MYIAEQQLLAAAVGLAVLGKTGLSPRPSPHSLHPCLRPDSIGRQSPTPPCTTLTVSHAGVSIGEDGPSQMALEDLAMMRAVFGSTVLYPCDPNQTAQLVKQMVDLPGISYLRTTREKTPVLYPASDTFPVGGSKVLRQSGKDRVTVVAAGITVHKALKACDLLQKEGIAIRVLDAYSVKPIDKTGLHTAATATGGKMVVVEDHWPEGGLGEAAVGLRRRSCAWAEGAGTGRAGHARFGHASGAAAHGGHRRGCHRQSGQELVVRQGSDDAVFLAAGAALRLQSPELATMWSVEVDHQPDALARRFFLANASGWWHIAPAS